MTNEIRPIDANALEADLRRQFESVYKNIRDTVSPEDFYIERRSAYEKELMRLEIDAICKYVQSRPTLDYVPVRHGEWISVEERLPEEFVSVLAHMTDAGEFPSVREAYVVCGIFFFPALRENHPVDYWAEMPELPKEG